MTARCWLLLLTAAALAAGVAAGAFAWAATRVKSQPDPVVAMLKLGVRPDDQAGDAFVIGAQASDRVRMLAEEAQKSARFNSIAAWLTIVSAILSAAAGLVGALMA